jgi:DNA-binding transcriptional ArsR family regulator
LSGSEKDRVKLVASALVALSDPSRLRVFRSLRLGCGAGALQANVAEDMGELTERIAMELNASPALVEQHLLELQRAGLLSCEEGRGGALRCRADEQTLAVIRQVLCETLGKANAGGQD